MVDYVRLAATAERLISKNGGPVTIRKLARADEDPDKPWRGPGTDVGLVAGSIADYDADAGVTADAQDRVSQWDDQSGAARHVVQTTDASKPLDGSGEITFDGVDDWLENLSMPDLDPPLTLFAVARYDAPADPTAPLTEEERATIVDWEQPGQVNQGVILFHDAPGVGGQSIFRYRDLGAVQSVIGPSLIDGLVHVHECFITESAGAGVLHYLIDGVEVGTQAWTTPNAVASTELYLGRLGLVAPPSFMFKGGMKRVTAYATELSAADRAKMRNFLVETYQVGVVTAQGVLLSYDEADVDGEIVKRGDRRALVSYNGAGGYDLREYDELEEPNGEKWRLQDVELVKPATDKTGVLYKLQLRR